MKANPGRRAAALYADLRGTRRRAVEDAGPVENAPPSPNRVSHRPLDGASGPAHTYHSPYDD